MPPTPTADSQPGRRRAAVLIGIGLVGVLVVLGTPYLLASGWSLDEPVAEGAPGAEGPRRAPCDVLDGLAVVAGMDASPTITPDIATCAYRGERGDASLVLVSDLGDVEELLDDPRCRPIPVAAADACAYSEALVAEGPGSGIVVRGADGVATLSVEGFMPAPIDVTAAATRLAQALT